MIKIESNTDYTFEIIWDNGELSGDEYELIVFRWHVNYMEGRRVVSWIPSTIPFKRDDPESIYFLAREIYGDSVTITGDGIPKPPKPIPGAIY